MTEHVLFPFIGQDIGGSHVSAFTLAQSLVQDFGHRCTVIARAGSRIATEAAAMGLGVIGTGEKTAGRHNPVYDAARVFARTALPLYTPTISPPFNHGWCRPGWPVFRQFTTTALSTGAYCPTPC
jgi:hypothetical protein